MPTVIATGVASPRAQGQDITSTHMPKEKAVAKSFVTKNHTAKVTMEMTTMAGTNTADILFDLPKKEKLGYVIIKENILKSQRIENFAIDVCEDGTFREIFTGTTVGYKRIVPLSGVKTDRLRIRITDARVAPTLSFIGIYRYNNDLKIGE